MIKFIFKNFISLIPFLSIIILPLGCSNKPVEKEIRMPMLFDTREQAEKEAYKFGCEGAHQMKKNECPAVCTNIIVDSESFTISIYNWLQIIFLSRFA